jgi:uncharacterized protein involved in type VI secretion and phage assembly
MVNGLVDAAANAEEPQERRIYGVTRARVINNRDCEGYHRVQIRIAWLPEVETWARVAAAMAGAGRGAYFIPQVDDEVLVVFEDGDVRQPYVVGSLWNGRDRPPAEQPEDAENRRLIRTQAGHEVSFDDSAGSICITNGEGHAIHLNRDEIRIEMSEQAATITLNDDGDMSIEVDGDLSIRARDIRLEAERSIELQSNNRLSINGGQDCEIRASTVRIN